MLVSNVIDKDLNCITHWMDPNARTHSKYGFISNNEWLNREMKRINEGKNLCVILENGIGQKCLSYAYGYFYNGEWVKN